MDGDVVGEIPQSTFLDEGRGLGGHALPQEMRHSAFQVERLNFSCSRPEGYDLRLLNELFSNARTSRLRRSSAMIIV